MFGKDPKIMAALQVMFNLPEEFSFGSADHKHEHEDENEENNEEDD